MFSKQRVILTCFFFLALACVVQAETGSNLVWTKDQEQILEDLEMDPSLAEKEADAGLKRVRKMGDARAIAEWSLLNGIVLQRTGQNLEAIKLLENCLPFFQKARTWTFEAETLNVLGILYRQTGDIQKALSCHNLALEIYKNIKNSRGIAESHNNLGIAYRNLGDMEEAKAQYNQGLSVVPDEDKEVQAALYNSLGSLFWYQEKILEAEDSYQKARALYEESGVTNGTYAGVLNNLGNTCRSLGKNDSALEFYSRAFKICEASKDFNLIAVIQKNLGLTHFSMGNLILGQQYLEDSLHIAQNSQLKRVMLEDLKTLAQIYQQQGKVSQAYQFLWKYIDEYEVHNRIQNMNSLSSIKAAHEVELKEKRIQLLKAQRDEMRLFYMLIFMVLIGLTGAVWLSRYRLEAKVSKEAFKKDHELQKKDMQLGRLQEEFSKVEDRYRRFFEGSPDAIIILERQRGEIVNANSLATELLGESLVGQSFYPFVPALFLEMVEKGLQQSPDHVLHGLETEILQSSGKIIPVEIAAQDLLFGTQSFLQVVVRDLRERKKLELQLLQSQKMEAIGTLAGGIAHDFNNLLTVIRGYCEILNFQSKSDGGQAKKIGEIDKAAERAQTLTRQLLAFSRKQVKREQVFCLNELIGEMLKMLTRLIGEKIHIETSLEPQLGMIKADKGQIEQVLMNLALNARDAMKEGGTLGVRTEQCTLNNEPIFSGIFASGEFSKLTISDNGEGMEESIQKHIFEPFFSTKKTGEGTGLGLSMVFGIVKHHQGFIRFQSTKGLGTDFEIFLPSCISQGEMSTNSEKRGSFQETTTRHGLAGAECILVVEDDESLRKMLIQVLKEHGYKVLEAASGEQGLELFRQNQSQLDLVITDIVMQGLNGKEMVQSFDAEFPREKVIFMSGHSSQVMKFEEIEDQGSILLEKPFTPRELLTMIRKQIDRQS